MTTYTVRPHPELDSLSEYDEHKLTKVIEEYNKWYARHDLESDRQHTNQNQVSWAHAIYHVKDYINENMVDAFSTLEETHHVVGKRYSYFPVESLFSEIDTIREELLEHEVHQTLLQHEPVLLMDILNKLETCTRRVIKNTSIQRLHQKSWVHADALAVAGGADALRASDAALLAPLGIKSQPEADISTLLCRMKQL